ncbi:MAG TPA: LamG-like jellyroll fold domain-containing protein [Verrucomicrobiae bacterium]|nr:LamG-like jellyroll fold domain-containing protein [Verrucomicrobiae bacterium]
MKSRILATLVVLASLMLNARADITTGLVGYWTFDDGGGSSNAVDSSGDGFTGYLTNFSDTTYTSMWTTHGKINGALIFNTNGESTDYVAVNDNPSLNFTNGLQFTLSAWINCSVAGASEVSGAGMIAHGYGNGGEQYALDLDAGKFRFYIRNSGGTAVQAISGTVPAAGTWYHLTAVFSGQSTNRQQILYVNGVSNVGVATASLATSLKFATNFVVIGDRQSSSSPTSYTLDFKGIIDDVRIYDRALTASDVYQLYAYDGNAPIISTQPRNVSGYLGDSPAFSVAVNTANSVLPVGYQWQFDGTNLAGGTAGTFVVTNAQAANAGSYTVIITNYIGVTTSAVAVLNLQTLPPVDTTTGLVGYWKFDDGAGSSTAADSTTNNDTGTLTDFADTTFSNMWTTNGLINGAIIFNGDGSGQDLVAVPNIGVAAPPVLDFSTNPVFTLSAWVKAPTTQTNGAGIIAKGTGNGGEQYVIDVDNGHFRCYVRDTNAVAYNAVSTVAPSGVWQQVAATLDASNGIMNLYVNGALATVAAAPFSLLENAHELTFGNRQPGTGAYSNAFTGTMDEVRIYNRALTSADIYALYLEGGVYPPTIAAQPQGASAYIGDNLTLSGLASGTAPLAYQWKQNGVNIPGATTSSLSFRPSVATNAGTYVLVVTNLYGVADTLPAVVTLTPWAVTNALAAYWTFDDGSGSYTAQDSSTNGNNGTLTDFPDYTSEWVQGRINGAINFNPPPVANEYVDVPYAPSLNFNTNLAFSISAWVKGAPAQANGAGIVAKGFGGVNEEYAMDVETTFFRFYVRNAASASTALLTGVSPNGTWQHVVGTYDGNAGVMNYYLNGQLVGTAAAPNTLLGENDHDLTIGCRESSTTSGYNTPFAGSIDDVRIYSRALSSNDVQTLYYAPGLESPVFDSPPQGGSLFVGNGYTLSALAEGTVPLSYQWLFDGSAISGATNSSLALTNLQTTNSGSYSLLVSNIAGTNVSAPAVLSISTFTIDDYVGYWKFDETNGLTAYDSSIYGDNGTLNNFPPDNSEWIPGRINGALDFNAAAGAYVSIPDSPELNFTNNLAFSIAFWVRGPASQINDAGIICKGYSPDEEYTIDYNDGGYRFYVRNLTGTSITLPTGVAPDGLWQHIVATYDGNAGLMAFYVNGQFVVNGSAPNSLIYSTHEVSIGAREASSTSGYNYDFNGAIDDVRIYPQALTAAEALDLYQSAPAFAPILYTQSTDSTNYTGTSVTLTALADGTAPLSFQWFDNSNSIPGATNATLAFPNVKLTNAGTYTLQVTNAVGSITSSNIVLTVLPAQFTGGMFLGDGTFQLSIIGPPYATFAVYTSTNLAVPLPQWTFIGNGTLDGNGQGSVIDVSAPQNPAAFYYYTYQE